MNDFGSCLKNRSILVVDDEKDVRETIEDLLEHPALDFAEDYETASEKIEHHKYDLAILDIMGVSGMKLLEECVKRQIPAIMLTANAVDRKSVV